MTRKESEKFDAQYEFRKIYFLDSDISGQQCNLLLKLYLICFFARLHLMENQNL